MAQITLGNISTQNGRSVVSGSQSGLDTDAIIKSLTEAKRLPAVRLETLNKTLDSKKTALTDMKSLLTRFRTAVDTLRNPPGVNNASSNIFEYRKASLSSIAGADNYLGVTVQPGANIQSLTINEISSIARESKQQTGVIQAVDANSAVVKASGDATAGQFSAGTLQLRVLDGGSPANVTLAENDSLNTIASKFNAVKDRTGIQATVVKVAGGTPNSDYQIIFTGTKTGLTAGFDLASTGTVLSDPDGVMGEVTASPDFATTQTAQNAVFKLDGVTITRESNTVNDLIDGITFSLKQPIANTTPITLSVSADTDIVTNAINAFADVYNELRVFQAKQNERGDDGLPTETAVLANDPTLRSIVTSVTDEITAMVKGITGGNPAALTDIGVNFQDFEGDEANPSTRNIIVINAEKLASALASNFEGVRNVFEFSATTDNNNLGIYKRTNALATNDFTVNIDRTNNVYTATVGGSQVALDMTQNPDGTVTLNGKAGTVLDGLQMIYAGTGDATVHVSLTQGIGDRLYNTIDNALATGGAMENSIKSIDDQTTRNDTEITKIDDSIERYRDQLLDTYSRLEAALTKANQLMSLLDAQASARENA